jgi:glycine cleavage system H protein
MPEFLEVAVDKFIFKVATDRLYAENHLWLKLEEGLVSVGLTDYLQQTAGDVAFVELNEVGAELVVDDSLGSVETMKITLDIPTPIAGLIKKTNARLEDEAELINQDPYSDGWLVLLEVDNWDVAKGSLLEPNEYYDRMKAEAEAEARNL